jgi:predicted aminopeptidase
MPNVFKNARAALTGSTAVVYTCPSATTAIVLLAQAANVDNSAAVSATATWSDGTNTTHLVKAVSIPQYAAVNLLAGKLVLEAGDSVSAFSTATNRVELTLSVLEIS